MLLVIIPRLKMADYTCFPWEDFLSLHKPQLQSAGLPEYLWKRLYQKLYPLNSNDIKEAFKIRSCILQDGKVKCSLRAKRKMEKFGDVYIVSHIWSSDGGKDAKQQLLKSSNLLRNVQDVIMRTEVETCFNSRSGFYDNMKILMDVFNVEKTRAKELLNISDDEIINALMHADHDGPKPKEKQKLSKQILTFEEFRSGFLSTVGEGRQQLLSDEYVRKMYTRYRKDKDQEKDDFLGKAVTSHYSWNEDDDGSINVLISVPPGVKKNQVINKITMNHWVFGVKGSMDKIIDGEFYDGIVSEECFWTFDSPGVVQMTLQKVDTDSRLWPVLMKCEKHLDDKEIYQQARKKDDELSFQIDEVLDNMWFYNQTYEAFYPQSGIKKRLWYIMDEFGSAITHSNEPNMRCVPFANTITGVFYSIIWPINDVKQEELCTRDFYPPLSPTESSLQIEARMLGCSGELPEHCPAQFYLKEQNVLPHISTPEEIAVTISSLSDVTTCLIPSTNMNGKVKKLYTDVLSGYCRDVLENLGCEVVTSAHEADTLWLSSSPSISNLKTNQKVNRLVGEQYLLLPSLLSQQVIQCYGKVPWFPITFSLRCELALICIDHYQNVGRYWIIKSAEQVKMPFEPVVTSNLQRVIRLAEPMSLVASHFVPSTLFYKKQHFCLQYAVVFTSIDPLELLVHNTPNVRLAAVVTDTRAVKIDEYNNAALVTVSSNNQVAFYEVLNYLKKFYLKQLQKSWEEIEKSMYQCFAKLFSAVSPQLSALGLCAVYGVDVLIKGDGTPLIIGIDSLPTFPDKDVAFEVLNFVLNSSVTASNCFTKINVSGSN